MDVDAEYEPSKLQWVADQIAEHEVAYALVAS